MNRNKHRKKILYNAKLMAVSAGMIAFLLHLQSFGKDQDVQIGIAASEVIASATTWELELPMVQGKEQPKYNFSFYQVPFGNLPEEVQIYTHEICEQYGIPAEIIFAMMQRESRFDSNAIGDEGLSFGYMQVMEKWHKDRMNRLGVDDLLDPEENILVAVDYLSELYERYGNMTCALMAYNCGPSTAKKMWDSGIWSTKYSEEVLKSSEQIHSEIYGGEQ